jgi:hypothetical protein
MRDRLRLRPGSKIVFEEQPNGDFVIRKKTGDIMDLKGMFPKPERPLSIEELDDALAREVSERDARSRQ